MFLCSTLVMNLTALVEPIDDVDGFRESTEETKEEMKKNLAMLGCVFRKMGLYDENNEINLESKS